MRALLAVIVTLGLAVTAEAGPQSRQRPGRRVRTPARRVVARTAVQRSPKPTIAQHLRQRPRELPEGRVRKVIVDSGTGSFRVEQTWVLRGVTREQLMGARKHLKLTGPTGLYGGAGFMTVPLAPSEQGSGGEIDVPGVRPRGVPKALGSRARTFLTADGFRAEMSGGRIGRGGSVVSFGATEMVGGVPQVTIREVGSYELRYQPRSIFEMPAMVFDRMSRLTPPGSLALSASLKQMGNLHNRAFEVGAAMLGALKVELGETGH